MIGIQLKINANISLTNIIKFFIQISNFEDYTICSWQQYKYDDFDWELNKGETDSYGIKINF